MYHSETMKTRAGGFWHNIVLFREFLGKPRASYFKKKLNKSFLQLWTLLSLLLGYG